MEEIHDHRSHKYLVNYGSYNCFPFPYPILPIYNASKKMALYKLTFPIKYTVVWANMVFVKHFPKELMLEARHCLLSIALLPAKQYFYIMWDGKFWYLVKFLFKLLM